MIEEYHRKLRAAVGQVRRVKGLFPNEKDKLCDLTHVRCPLALYQRCAVRPISKGLEAGLKIANNNPDHTSDNKQLANQAERQSQVIDKLYEQFAVPLCAYEIALGASLEDIARENGI